MYLYGLHILIYGRLHDITLFKSPFTSLRAQYFFSLQSLRSFFWWVWENLENIGDTKTFLGELIPAFSLRFITYHFEEFMYWSLYIIIYLFIYRFIYHYLHLFRSVINFHSLTLFPLFLCFIFVCILFVLLADCKWGCERRLVDSQAGRQACEVGREFRRWASRWVAVETRERVGREIGREMGVWREGEGKK